MGPDPEQAKTLIHDAFRSAWSGDLSVFADDYVDHDMMTGLPPNRDGFATLRQMTLTAFPDFEVEVRELVAEGDMVAALVINRGTNTGSFMGMPPSGKRAEWKTIAMFRLRDDKIVERWGVIDALSMLRQIGALPVPGAQASRDG